MSEPENPWNQLLNIKGKRGTGNLSALQKRLWTGLNIVAAGLIQAMGTNDSEMVLKWLSMQTQIAHAFIKCISTSEFEERIAKLEAHSKRSGTDFANGY